MGNLVVRGMNHNLIVGNDLTVWELKSLGFTITYVEKDNEEGN